MLALQLMGGLRSLRTACLGACVAVGLAHAQPASIAATAPTAPAAQKLRVVGGLAGINQFTRNEEPFWSKELARLSGGKYTADIVPFDRAGVPGSDMLHLMELGVIPLGTALLSTASSQYPEYGAPDLAGLNPDFASIRKTVAAFRPYLQKSLRDAHGIEMLAIYTYPAQVLFCKKAIAGLSDLAGRRIRVASATQSDFVSALGGVPVLVGFAQVLPNMASGNTECAITGTMTGFTMGLHEVTQFVHRMPITWGLAIFGANQAAWNALPGDLRALLSRELPKLEAAIWNESERETQEGFACNRGAESCAVARKGKMAEVATSENDERLRREIFTNVVLPRWLQRCNNRCLDLWNKTIGPAQGIVAQAAK
jgi:TRAP-type C4-dicarboxylate transport system substrate-binding protein